MLDKLQIAAMAAGMIGVVHLTSPGFFPGALITFGILAAFGIFSSLIN